MLAYLVLSCSAWAQSGGTGAPGGTAPEPGQPTTPSVSQGDPPGKSVRLLGLRSLPRNGYLYGMKRQRFELTISAKRPTDLRIDLVAKGAGVQRSLSAADVPPNRPTIVAWDGLTTAGLQARGSLFLRVTGVNGEPIAISKRFRGKPRFGVYDHIFPIRGKHSYGDGMGAGRGHQGQDMPARCGTKLVAARGGTVKARAYQAGGAGHYLVIDGAGNGNDYVYMHMLAASPLRVGQTVKTGQAVGQVGSTGRSTGCHLHFEIWGAPGWYTGGEPMDASPPLRAWDVYS